MEITSTRENNTIDSILQVTKSTVQQNQKFYNYYLKKDNTLYRKQLPLLVHKYKMNVLSKKKIENEKSYIQNVHKSSSTDNILLPLNAIRHAQIRSKKLPPLCPFYNDKGELVRSVIVSSKIQNKYMKSIMEDNLFKKIKLIKIGSKPRGESIPGLNSVDINFDQFQFDYFYEPEYSSLVYQNSHIFGKKEHYLDIIKNKVNELKTIDINNLDLSYNKQKIFDKNKRKSYLNFNSISVKIYEMQEPLNGNEKEKEKENKNEDIKDETQIFEYNLPFAFLPLFYLKGEEKFKIFLSRIIKWDNLNNKFILNENPQKAFIDILKNCLDFNKEEKKEEQQKPVKKEEPKPKAVKQKFSLTLGKKSFKSQFSVLKIGGLNNTISEEQNLAQTMAGPNPGMYLTNLEEKQKKLEIIFQSSIYPNNKENNYINYNIFEFFWITESKSFKVHIYKPLVSIEIPKNNIKVRKYIDFELLFYLYENNFKNWDFYLIKYLSSYKSFRTLLEQINSINEISDKNFYLIKPRIKSYIFNNIKIINITTLKQRDVLKNLLEGLMGIPEENEQRQDEINKEENKIEADKEKEEDNKNKEDKKDENLIENKEEDSNNEVINSTFVQKSFISIVRFVNTKTYKAQEYKIYFNFNQHLKFQKMEKYIDKISFLIKFIHIDYIKQKVTMNYKSLDDFDENKWIKEYNLYNMNVSKTVENENKIDKHRTSAEYLGMIKNSIIQIEILTPISLARILGESGSIRTEKVILNNNYQNNLMKVEKDNILQLSKIFYTCYEEEQDLKNKS